ncbi:MAG: ABC transporter permease [Saprospiraceae bacterium]|nr:ABC transporter permease [Saprospiraceae bacterium]
MIRFITKRFLWLFPTVLLVLVLTFSLTKLVPGDPVYMHFFQGTGSVLSEEVSDQDYAQATKALGLDLPIFYLAILPLNHTDSIYKVPYRESGLVKVLLREFGDWSKIVEFKKALSALMENERKNPESQLYNGAALLIYGSPSVYQISRYILEIDQQRPDRQRVVEAYASLSDSHPGIKAYVPTIRWYGLNNQFHRWLKNVIRFEFGDSTFDQRPIGDKVVEALPWTLTINLTSIFLAYLISIPLGVYMGWQGGRLWQKMASLVLYAVYSIPLFWMATICIVFLTTSEYGSWTNIFPAAGIWEAPPGNSFGQIFWTNLNQLMIPVLCLTLSMTAFVTRQMQSSVSDEKVKKYVWHARAKGLGESTIMWRHVFRNASFPLITMIAGILPASISGSLVLEVICNVPGMGRLMFDSIFNQDWLVVILVVYIAAILTIIGLLLADVLYKLADPRIKISMG